MTEHGIEHEACCGRRAAHFGQAAGRREPFAFPGTSKRYSRDRLVDVRHIRLEISVDPAQRKIAGVARHTVAALNDGADRIVFDAAELTIDGVTDTDGKALAFDHSDGALTVHLAKPVAAGTEMTISVAYHGSPRRGIYFIGPDEAYPDKPVQAWTQGQDEDSRYWFPCFDYPNEKATVEVLATVPSRYTAVSNGALVGKTSSTAKGAGSPAGSGGPGSQTTWHWKIGIPQVAYLVTLVVGEFDEVKLAGDIVPLTAYVPKGSAKEAERAFGRTGKMVAHFSERFGVAYPYEKYAQLVVSDFIFGGMENTTATTLTEYALYDDRAALDYDVDDLIAHELGHQWWGDLLTCRDWSHAWLNEGFATWCEAVFKEHHLGKDEAAFHLYSAARRYFAEDGGDYRRPIVSKNYEAPIDVFDRHLYEKGGCVLHMLRAELGEEAFWKSIRAYATANRGKNVMTDDLRRAVEDATGKNLEWFFDQWVHSGGYPEIKASWSWDADSKVLSVSLKQTHRADEQTPEVFRATLKVDVRTGKESKVHEFKLTEREHTFHLQLHAKPDSVRFDPEGTLLAAWTIEQGFDAHRKALANDPSMICRLRAASALAKDPCADTVAALARAVKSDAFWGASAEAASALAEIRTPAAREALLACLSETKHPKARRAVVQALGQFRGDEAAGEALRDVLVRGDKSLFVEAEAADALGRTRTPGAREAIEAALLKKDSWAEAIRGACVRGLGHLATDAVIPTLAKNLEYGKHQRLRSNAAMALAEVGSRMVVRDAVRDLLEARIDDKDFRVQMAAIAALRYLGDDRAIGTLRRAADQAVDGRIRRACRVAARRLEQRSERTSETAKLSDAVEAMRRQSAEFLTRLQKLEARFPKSKATSKSSKAAKSAKSKKRKR